MVGLVLKHVFSLYAGDREGLKIQQPSQNWTCHKSHLFNHKPNRFIYFMAAQKDCVWTL